MTQLLNGEKNEAYPAKKQKIKK